MIKLGEYLIQANKITWTPDSMLRHHIVSVLAPYWVAEQRRKFLDDKRVSKRKLFTSKKDICYDVNVADKN